MTILDISINNRISPEYPTSLAPEYPLSLRPAIVGETTGVLRPHHNKIRDLRTFVLGYAMTGRIHLPQPGTMLVSDKLDIEYVSDDSLISRSLWARAVPTIEPEARPRTFAYLQTQEHMSADEVVDRIFTQGLYLGLPFFTEVEDTATGVLYRQPSIHEPIYY